MSLGFHYFVCPITSVQSLRHMYYAVRGNTVRPSIEEAPSLIRHMGNIGMHMPMHPLLQGGLGEGKGNMPERMHPVASLQL